MRSCSGKYRGTTVVKGKGTNKARFLCPNNSAWCYRFSRASRGLLHGGCLKDAAPRAQVSPANLKLDARLVVTALLAPMSFH